MKGSTDPGRRRCEATLLQMNDAKADLEGKGVNGDEVFLFIYQQQSYFNFLTTNFSLVA